MGRFINADGEMAGVGSVQGLNLFQYCMNNPVMMIDPSGCWPTWGQIFTAAAIVVTAAVVVTAIVVTAGAAGAAVGAAAAYYGASFAVATTRAAAVEVGA